MPMEHRWSERKPVVLDVSLTYPPLGIIRGRTVNISLEGMFVVTDGVELPPNAELEVSFVTEDDGRRQEHHLRGYVVHGGSAGAGLMLRHVDSSGFNALRYLVQAA